MNQVLSHSSNGRDFFNHCVRAITESVGGRHSAALVAVLALQASCATAVYAQSGALAGQGYLGASVQSYDYQDTQVSEVSTSALRLQAGAQLSDGVAIEAHYGVGLGEETIQFQGAAQTLEIDHFRAVYVKPMLPVNPQVSAYGLLGYAEAQMLVDTQQGGAPQRFREYGTSYGVGAQLHLNPYTALTIEYVRLLDETDFDASSLGVGVNMAF